MASRPHMPGYALSPASAGLLPWEWAVDRLAASRRFWLATASPAGVPHLAAVWAVWHDDRLFFSTGGRSRKALDLATRRECSLSTESAAEAVVTEGHAARVDTGSAGAVRAYAAKYGEPPPPAEPLFSLLPRTVIAVIEAADQFQQSATRWTFEG